MVFITSFNLSGSTSMSRAQSFFMSSAVERLNVVNNALLKPCPNKIFLSSWVFPVPGAPHLILASIFISHRLQGLQGLQAVGRGV